MWKSKTPRPVLGLQPFTPEYVDQQHKLYSDELVELLNDDERRKNVRNIALTGNYGSGKSSVLAGVRAQLKKKRVVQVSLSALSGVGVNPTRSDDPRSLELTNYIQKEIVKQLLYQERPTKVQGSCFRRLSRPARRRAAWISLLGAAVVVGVLWLTGWGAPLVLDPSAEGQRPFILAGIGLFASLALYFGQLLFANKWRLDKIGTASTSISLAGGDNADTYFDEYLDEIVYFFEMTRRDVVIIEDLDRFEDPSIYASLRELNTLLNASNQLRSRPVHFIYAVRDSILNRPGFDGGLGVSRLSWGSDFLSSHATVMMRLRSNSIGLSHPSWLCRRLRLCQTSRYSNIALANSMRVFHFLRSSSSTCIRDQNDSIIELS